MVGLPNSDAPDSDAPDGDAPDGDVSDYDPDAQLDDAIVSSLKDVSADLLNNSVQYGVPVVLDGFPAALAYVYDKSTLDAAGAAWIAENIVDSNGIAFISAMLYQQEEQRRYLLLKGANLYELEVCHFA
jgi:hypothetical protein